MEARQGRSPMTLLLSAGQVQRVLVEAGSTLVVTRGALRVCFPFAWLAESVVAQALPLRAEEAHCLADGGWIELLAAGAVEVVILPPEAAGLWMRVGRCVERLLAVGAGKVAAGKVATRRKKAVRTALFPTGGGGLR